MRPYNPSGSFVGMNAYGNLGNHQRNLHGSTNEIYRSSTNISFDNEKRTGVNESYRFSQANGSRNEVVTERYSTYEGPRVTRRPNYDQSGPTLYSTNPYATWKRYSKPDLSSIGGGGGMPMSGSLGDGRRRQMFASQTSLSSVGAHAYNQSRSASPNKRVQPVQISCYTSSRQRNRITPRNSNIESAMSYQPVPPVVQAAPPPVARPPSQLGFGGGGGMGSRRSSVTSLDVIRPLQVSASHWQPIKSKREEITIPASPQKPWQVGIYAKDLFPSPEQLKAMAQVVSRSLFDPRNANAKGGKMFLKRQERAAQYTLEGYGRNDAVPREFAQSPCTLEDLQERAKEHKIQRMATEYINHGIPLPPNPEDLLLKAENLKNRRQQQQKYTVFDPQSGTHRVVKATNFEVDLSDDERCEHNIVTPSVCAKIVRDLRSSCGRGSNMFQKRCEKSLKWVTDETNRRGKSFGIVEAIKSGRITEDALEQSLSRMYQARPERLPSMTSVIKQLTPWEAAAEGIPVESTMKSGAEIMAEAMNKASAMNERRQKMHTIVQPVANIATPQRIINLSQLSLNNPSENSVQAPSAFQAIDRSKNRAYGNYSGSNDQTPSLSGSRPASTVSFSGAPRGGVAMPGMTGVENRGPMGFRSALNANKTYKPINFSSSNLAGNNMMSQATAISAEL